MNGEQTIHLTTQQVRMAELIGAERTRSAVDAERTRPFEPVGDRLRHDQDAAGAEIAAASMLGAWWSATEGIGATDLRLGRVGYEVRWSAYEDGFMTLYPKDADSATFVFVTGRLPYYEIRGAVRARDVKRDEHWKTHNPRGGAELGAPCWCVPQSALGHLEVIRCIVSVVHVIEAA